MHTNEIDAGSLGSLGHWGLPDNVRRFRQELDAPAWKAPAVPLTPPTGLSVEVQGVAKAYGERRVLDGLALTLAPGEFVAIVGRSGCGKSTLLAATMGLLPVRGYLALTTSGDQTELGDIASGEVPPLVAGSLQGDHVFDTTLRDNLRVVRPDASDNDLDDVAARVGLADFVRSLPQGWSTVAGPDAANLSGGQRQRLLLARALLADPRILVLDEPTAHLDAETEKTVLDDLLSATHGRTVLLTTHRSMAGREDAIDAFVRIDPVSTVGTHVAESV